MYDGEVKRFAIKRSCFDPCAGNFEEYISKLCGSRRQALIFEVCCSRNVSDLPVSGLVVIIHTYGVEGCGERVEGYDPTGFSAILDI
jgi:hypothetical protein